MRTLLFLTLAVLATAVLATRPGSHPHHPHQHLYKSDKASVSVLKSGWGPENVTQHSGYITVNTKVDNGGHLFFWMFESRGNPSTGPLVLWMTGGPGCSSELALFYENGPYHFDSNGNMISNKYSWNNNVNLLYIDQPVGTGFSYADYPDDYVTSETQVAEDMYQFLQAFMGQFPQYANLPFYVTGESYGGHYVPAVSHRILQGNTNREGTYINMQGLAIGNGMVNGGVQYADYGTFAYDNGLITLDQLTSLNGTVQQCLSEIQNNDPNAFDDCGQITGQIQEWGNNFNVYDIRIPCGPSPLCYDFSALDNLLAQSSVLSSLGVDTSKSQWSECNSQVYQDLTSDWMLNCETFIPPMLAAGYKVLVYSGKEDFICNWFGGQDWVNQMQWPGQQQYQNEAWQTWVQNGATAGSFKTVANFTFLGVNAAGHMVPMDQPQNAITLLENFINDVPFQTQN